MLITSNKSQFKCTKNEENKNVLGDPDHIAPNTVVVIPPAEKYGIKAGDKQSEADAMRRAEAIINSQKWLNLNRGKLLIDKINTLFSHFSHLFHIFAPQSRGRCTCRAAVGASAFMMQCNRLIIKT